MEKLTFNIKSSFNIFSLQISFAGKYLIILSIQCLFPFSSILFCSQHFNIVFSYKIKYTSVRNLEKEQNHFNGSTYVSEITWIMGAWRRWNIWKRTRLSKTIKKGTLVILSQKTVIWELITRRRRSGPVKFYASLPFFKTRDEPPQHLGFPVFPLAYRKARVQGRRKGISTPNVWIHMGTSYSPPSPPGGNSTPPAKAELLTLEATLFFTGFTNSPEGIFLSG